MIRKIIMDKIIYKKSLEFEFSDKIIRGIEKIPYNAKEIVGSGNSRFDKLLSEKKLEIFPDTQSFIENGKTWNCRTATIEL